MVYGYHVVDYDFDLADTAVSEYKPEDFHEAISKATFLAAAHVWDAAGYELSKNGINALDTTKIISAANTGLEGVTFETEDIPTTDECNAPCLRYTIEFRGTKSTVEVMRIVKK